MLMRIKIMTNQGNLLMKHILKPGRIVTGICALFVVVHSAVLAEDMPTPEPSSRTQSSPANNQMEFQTNLFTGTFSYSIPIVGAPARASLSPPLSLSYTSSAGNGWCGLGWTLDPGFIVRDTTHGVPIDWDEGSGEPLSAYDDDKNYVFRFSFNGIESRLVKHPTLANHYYPEIGGLGLHFKLHRQTSDPDYNSWTVTDASGNEYRFGCTFESRMENPKFPVDKPSSTFKWLIDEQRDPNNNRIDYTYQSDAGQVYLRYVRYNFTPSGPPTHRLRFVRETGRTDVAASFRSGYEVKTLERLTNIVCEIRDDASSPWETIKRYKIEYRESNATKRSLIDSVEVFGSDNTTSLPATTFEYQENTMEFHPTTTWDNLDDEVWPQNHEMLEWHDHVLDWNGGNPRTYNLCHHTLMDMDRDGLIDKVMTKSEGYAGQGASGQDYDQYAWQRNTGSDFEPVRWMSFTPANDYHQLEFIRDDAARLLNLDLNADGFPDRVRDAVYGDGFFKVEYHNGQDDYASEEDFGPVVYWHSSDNSLSALSPYASVSGESKVALMDMNGDGLLDRVTVGPAPFDYFVVYLNTGSGFGPELHFRRDTSIETTDFHSLKTTAPIQIYVSVVVAAMLDLNGDGILDRVLADSDRVWESSTPPGDGELYNEYWVMYGNGYGFEAPAAWIGALDPLPTNSTEKATWGAVEYRTPAIFGDYGGQTHHMMKDINGDGLPDRVRSHYDGEEELNYGYQINTGLGFEEVRFISFEDWNLSFDTGLYPENGILSKEMGLLDINGDGLPDRVGRGDPNANDPYGNCYRVQLQKGPAPDLMMKVNNSYGGTVEVSYKPSTAYDNTDSNGVSQLGSVFWCVDQLVSRDGLGMEVVTQYARSGGYYDYARKEFAGFHKVTTINMEGSGVCTYFHQGGGVDDSAGGEWMDAGAIAKRGLPYKVELIGSDGKIYQCSYSQVEELGNIEPMGSGRRHAYVKNTVMENRDQYGAKRRTLSRLKQIDLHTGLPEASVEKGEIESFNPAAWVWSHTDFDDDLFSHTEYYDDFGSLGRSDLPQRVYTSSDAAGLDLLSEILYEYDSVGNLTAEKVRDLDSGDLIISRTEYNTYGGNVSKVINPEGLVTEYTYEPVYEIYVDSETVDATGFNLVTTMNFDPRSGQLLDSTDQNLNVTSTTYDALYRPILETITPYGENTIIISRSEYQIGGVDGSNSFNFSRRRVNDVQGGYIDTYNYMDGLGRHVQTRTEAETGQFRVTDTKYDDLGRITFVSRLYFGSGADYIPMLPGQAGTTTEYDVVNRPVLVTPPEGDATSPTSPSWTWYSAQDYYSPTGTQPWGLRTYDANGRYTAKEFDAFGRTIRIGKYSYGAEVETHFVYDRKGNLREILDDTGLAANKVVFEYDSLNRRTMAHHPDTGIANFEYDNMGRLKRQTDAKNQVIEHDYDLLSRTLETRVYDSIGELDETISFEYDSSDDALFPVKNGELYRVTDREGFERYGYDQLGNLIRRERYLSKNDSSYTMRWEYDEMSRVTAIFFPNATSQRYVYDSAANLIRVTIHNELGQQIEVAYEVQDFDELGKIEGINYGNGVETEIDYYQKSKRTRQLKTLKETQVYQELSYEYDSMGNPNRIWDGVHSGAASGSMESILIDDLYRLKGYTRENGQTHTFSYDSLGRIMNNSEHPSGGVDYNYDDPVHVHAVTSVGSSTYQYDASGNMISRDGQNLEYNARNQLVKVSEGPKEVTYGYDHNGKRLWRLVEEGTDTGNLSVWINGAYEIKDELNKAKEIKYFVIVGGRRVCEFKRLGGEEDPLQVPGTFRFTYYSPDHLQGANVLTNNAGNKVQHFEYQAFGQDYYVENTTNRQVTNRYTDQAKDADTGLYYYGARYYDPALGRFIQADSIVYDAQDFQAYDLYAYVRNNPLRYADPTGNMPDSGVAAAAVTAGAAVAQHMAGSFAQIGSLAAMAGQSGSDDAGASGDSLGSPDDWIHQDYVAKREMSCADCHSTWDPGAELVWSPPKLVDTSVKGGYSGQRMRMVSGPTLSSTLKEIATWWNDTNMATANERANNRAQAYRAQGMYVRAELEIAHWAFENVALGSMGGPGKGGKNFFKGGQYYEKLPTRVRAVATPRVVGSKITISAHWDVDGELSAFVVHTYEPVDQTRGFVKAFGLDARTGGVTEIGFDTMTYGSFDSLTTPYAPYERFLESNTVIGVDQSSGLVNVFNDLYNN